MWQTCCNPTSSSCALKQVTASVFKQGYSRLDIGYNGATANRRRWLTLTLVSTYSDGGAGGTLVITVNPLSGAQTVTGSISGEPGVPPNLEGPPGLVDNPYGGVVVGGSGSETEWTTSTAPSFSGVTITTTWTLSSENTDAMVYANAIALLANLVINGNQQWDAVPLNHQVQLSYDSNGNVAHTIGNFIIGPLTCQIPAAETTIAGTTEYGLTALLANAALNGGTLSIMWSRFYNQSGCILTRSNPSDSTLPAIPDACAPQAICGGDANGAYCDVGPVNIQSLSAEDPRYYQINLELMTPPTQGIDGPSEWPNGGFAATWPGPVASDGNPWNCHCQELP